LNSVVGIDLKNGVQNLCTSKTHLRIGFTQNNWLNCIGKAIIILCICQTLNILPSLNLLSRFLFSRIGQNLQKFQKFCPLKISSYMVKEFITSIFHLASVVFMRSLFFFEFFNLLISLVLMSSYGHNSKLLMTYFMSCGFKVKRLAFIYLNVCICIRIHECLFSTMVCMKAVSHKVQGLNPTLDLFPLHVLFHLTYIKWQNLKYQSYNRV